MTWGQVMQQGPTSDPNKNPVLSTTGSEELDLGMHLCASEDQLFQSAKLSLPSIRVTVK